MESNDLLNNYDEVQSLISRVQSYILNNKNTKDIYSKLRRKLKQLVESTFSQKRVDLLIKKDFLKLILNTYNLMQKIEIESQLHTLELVSLVVGRIFLRK
jgi:type I site-specific restriction endonuclease